ncbi:hypothetical protein CH063_07309, partial [Colletotrichum higginsianum]
MSSNMGDPAPGYSGSSAFMNGSRGAPAFGQTGIPPSTNNKRSFGNASEPFSQSSPGRSKSQRTNDVLSDIIDLTGDDDEINTSISRSRQREAMAQGSRAAMMARRPRPYASRSTSFAPQPATNG